MTDLARDKLRSSLNPQRDLAQMMFSKRLVRFAGVFQPKRSVHVNFKRTGIDQLVESVDECRATFSIVCLDFDTVRSGRLRHHAMWIRDTSAFTNRCQGSISFRASRSDKCSVDSVRRELPCHVQNIIASSVVRFISSQFFGKLPAVFTRCDGEHIRTKAFGEL